MSRSKGATLEQLLGRAIELHQSGQLADAERLYRQVLNARPDHVEGKHLFGILRSQQGRHREALDLISAALKRITDHAPALYNRGNIYAQLKLYPEAVADYDRALAISPDYLDAWQNRGNSLLKLNRFEDALTSFQRALAINRNHAQALDGRGTALMGLRQFEAALASHDQALAVWPNDAGALSNRGNALKALRRYDEALQSYDRALTLRPDFVDALNNRGFVLKEFKRFDAALANFERALAIDGESADGFIGAADAALALCDWPRTHRIAAELHHRFDAGIPSVSPFTLLGYSDDAALHRRCAAAFIADKTGGPRAALWDGRRWTHEKLRVAYLSADFHNHATAFLMVELFERHDRERFEVHGVSFGPDDGSAMRRRLVQAFDRFHDVRASSDPEVARLLNGLEIDIAVDLKGYTQDSRPEILSYRPAPIQVSYLGYPGTMGADFIDYILADPIVLPLDRQPVYAEKIVQLPDCYQVNDRQRVIAATTPTRRAAGLPDQGFVFCCFNKNYKITAPMFDVWMRLLQSVPGSVLWLLRENAGAEANLRGAARAGGIDPTRLVFAGRLTVGEHLARHRLADLFLDTLPYNAHTTASDALWAGLPVLTCQGDAFAARVASSLLAAVGLPELVTTNIVAYEALALSLAQDTARLGAIRAKLARHRDTHPLFDTDRFRRHVEAAYFRMWETWLRGDAPQAFAVMAEAF
jgi:protein O-GlcNAc transferase